MRAFLGKLLATAVVILVAWHALGQLDAQQPIIDAWNDTRTGGTSVQVDNPLGDLDPDTALEQLDGITVTTPADVDYDRVGQFGKSWVFDFDTNGCDTRIICSSSVPRRDIPGLDLH